jgi:hypothetical protein
MGSAGVDQAFEQDYRIAPTVAARFQAPKLISICS